jgi:hypothetical protein
MLISRKLLYSLWFLLGLAVFPLSLAAAEGSKKAPQTPGQDNSSDATPTVTGKGKVTEAVDTLKGAIFDIGGGVTLTLPKGLPIGHSRLVTLKTTNQKPVPSQIHPRFQRLGATLHFNGALNTAKAPIVLALSSKKEPVKARYKLVLAIEEAGLCAGNNKGSKLGAGLCSTWRTVDAQYDSASGRVVAKLKSTGGYRLQFGWIPEA